MQARSNQNQKTICHRLLCREFLTSGPVEPVVCGGKCTTVRYGAVWAHIACPSHQWSNRWSNPWCRAVGPEAAASPFRPRAPGTRARLSHVRHSPLQRPLGRPLVQPPVGGCVPTRPHGFSLCSNAASGSTRSVVQTNARTASPLFAAQMCTRRVRLSCSESVGAAASLRSRFQHARRLVRFHFRRSRQIRVDGALLYDGVFLMPFCYTHE